MMKRIAGLLVIVLAVMLVPAALPQMEPTPGVYTYVSSFQLPPANCAAYSGWINARGGVVVNLHRGVDEGARRDSQERTTAGANLKHQARRPLDADDDVPCRYRNTGVLASGLLECEGRQAGGVHRNAQEAPGTDV